jgi:hypothetical protein
MLLYAVQSSHIGLFTAALVIGLAIGVLGHLSKARWLIITGILIIGLVSAYFSFVLQPSGR